MRFDDDGERNDPFEAFGDVERADEGSVKELAAPMEAATQAPQGRPRRIRLGFSLPGLVGGVAAFLWVGAVALGVLSFFGPVEAARWPIATQAAVAALALAPALLFWVAASAATEALRARRLALALTELAEAARGPFETREALAQRLGGAVKAELDALNESVGAALDRLFELETVAQRSAAMFTDVVSVSRESSCELTDALVRERDAAIAINADIRVQAEAAAHSVSRQVRLMREASGLVKLEMEGAGHALERHLVSFATSAAQMCEHASQCVGAADSASAASESLNSTMSDMLDGLSEATRLTDAARQSAHEALTAANDTASALQETTRGAVFEARRAAEFVRSETAKLHEVANDTLQQLRETAEAARKAAEASQAAAERHAASIGKRLNALAQTASPQRVASPPAPETPRPAPAAKPRPVWSGLRTSAHAHAEPTLQPANESGDRYGLVEFDAPAAHDPAAALKDDALYIISAAGVDINAVLHARDLERIADASRSGAQARRRAVLAAAPGAVGRIARHVQRDARAQGVALEFRSRADLAKNYGDAKSAALVRAYLLIDAALA